MRYFLQKLIVCALVWALICPPMWAEDFGWDVTQSFLDNTDTWTTTLLDPTEQPMRVVDTSTGTAVEGTLSVTDTLDATGENGEYIAILQDDSTPRLTAQRKHVFLSNGQLVEDVRPGNVERIDNSSTAATNLTNRYNGWTDLFFTTVSSLTNPTTVVLNSGSGSIDTYNGWDVVIVDAGDVARKHETTVTDYSAQTITIEEAAPFTPVSGDRVVLAPPKGVRKLLADVIDEASIEANAYTDAKFGPSWIGGDALSTGALSDIKNQADLAIEEANLNHLMKDPATDGDFANDSALAQLAATTGIWSDFDRTTDALQSLKDSGLTADVTAIDGNGPAATSLKNVLTGVGGETLTANITGSLSGSVDSVTGAVGSVTGNVGGNVTGSVGSVSGNVDGSVASVVGNVGGNVVGSVASVTGNVGGSVASVTGNVGGIAGTLNDFDEANDKMLGYVQLLARSDSAIATDRSVELGEINANEGTGLGAFASTSDSQQALRSRGDAAWITATIVDLNANQSGVNIGSVDGAVGSVTGNVGGNVVGSVASVAGNVGGNVTGSVGSVAGNVDGNVSGSVASVANAPTNWSNMVISAGGAVDSLEQGVLDTTYAAEATPGRMAGNRETFWVNSDAATTRIVNDVGSVAGAPTVQQIVDGLLDEALSGHVDVGSVGERIGRIPNETIHNFDPANDLVANVTATASVTNPVTAGTVTDKTGYSLTQAFPANFAAQAISLAGEVTVGTNNDKSGYSLTVAPLDAAGIRGAVGLATANIDNQFDDLPTAAENRIEMDANSIDLDAILEDTGTTLPTQIAGISAENGASMLNTTIDTVVDQQTLVLAGGAPDDNAYSGLLVVITDQTTSDQKTAIAASAWDAGSLTLSLESDPTFTVAAGDSVSIFAIGLPTKDTRDLSNVQQPFRLARTGANTLRSINARTLTPAQTWRTGADCDIGVVLPGTAVLASMTEPKVSPDDGSVSVTKLGIGETVAKFQVVTSSSATVGTYWISFDVTNDLGGGPITVYCQVDVVSAP